MACTNKAWLGLAAINAVTQHVFRRAGYEPDLAANSLGSLRIGPGDRVGMIGFFPPLVERVRALGLPLTVGRGDVATMMWFCLLDPHEDQPGHPNAPSSRGLLFDGYVPKVGLADLIER